MAAYIPVFFVMQFICIVCVFYPWSPSWPYARQMLHLPLALFPLWVAYEALMPPQMNIRVDLFLLGMEVAFVGGLYLIRIQLFKSHDRAERSGESEPHQE